MTTRKRFLARIKELGAHLDETVGDDIRVEAPIGHVWTSTGCHELIVAYGLSDAWKRSDAYADAMRDMSMGIERCTIPNCEWCADNGIEIKGGTQ